MNKQTKIDHDRFSETAHAFVSNVRRTMRVLKVNEDGVPTGITQQELADRWGVSRSTVAEYINGDTDGRKPANPDLRTLCHLSDVLHIPAAYLLMRKNDWSELAQAIQYFQIASRDQGFLNFASDLMGRRALNPVEIAQKGMELAKKLGIYEKHDVDGIFKANFEERAQRVKTGIWCASAMLPTAELQSDAIPILLILCAMVGAQTK